MQTRFI